MRKWFALFFALVLMMSPAAYAENQYSDEFHQGTTEWVERCVTEGSTATIRVTDADMNISSTSIQSFDIEVWSDSDRLEKKLTVSETGINTGVFEGIVFFKTLDDSSGHRVRAFDGDTVYAKYVDETLPNSKLEKEKISTFVMSDLQVIDWLNSKPTKLLYDPCTIKYLEGNGNASDQIEIFYPSPSKQIKSGLLINEIKCKENLILSYKYNVSIISTIPVVTPTPMCLKEDSREKLLERGWLQHFLILPDAVHKRTFPVEIDGEFHSISYNVKNANISKIAFDSDAQSLITYIQTFYSDADLEITIPRDVMDAKIGYCLNDDNPDDMFFVLINREEVTYSETETTGMYRTLSIPLKENSSEIEIIGACHV